ncbi:MAG: hypothetical protein Ct9H300mP8_00930 [Gammaproteobacteria bacterium]|nr:MAG: hypothetical protein Ct9H300mP8_00930 [Gammaproteobacteria bacterium]
MLTRMIEQFRDNGMTNPGFGCGAGTGTDPLRSRSLSQRAPVICQDFSEPMHEHAGATRRFH